MGDWRQRFEALSGTAKAVGQVWQSMLGEGRNIED
jgi:hypothetical protein